MTDRIQNTPPTFLLTAEDPQAPTLLRALAAKVRPMDQLRADKIDAEAVRFETWRREHLRR